MKKLASVSDPLWYKDAIIYELHVRAFADSNNDGVGDFQGLISKLDYLQDLGVTCLWLLPFFPSPLRDDGYDIANYVDVNPAYGTLADFKQFLDAAHSRNLQVMIELVINHTSDQHPWFKAARSAPPGSPEREMYVWSETDQRYKDARIIFTDTEKSNWTWDDSAQAYYWHRFFSHQPDLNFDNPRVIEEVIAAMRFWLDMGVDALRMDAIPYLVERDQTTCENLPETHAVIKKIRAAIDVDYANRLILAEANQWPVDVRPYFGDGDECHMAFHFPLMPRIYMALRQEDRLPITDIMAQTPTIPDSCQWGLFLRNHDELTLEMVTDDERDYMYLAYSADPRMRINVGIRRRLAPLVDNNRRRIELLNSLLLSFPGTPILYYGDEIGMGDNIYLGDRNGVRTPMQWNSDRNAGFSKCDPARLYFPVVMDPIYGYQTVNVEMQQSDQSSLLHWTRNMIALRKLFQVFGRGTLEFLNPANRKILAYLRSLTREDGSVEVVLCVANLSRFAQPVDLDLAPFAGMVPVEMLGYVSFPPITAGLYPLTLAPYSFLWFELQPPQPTHPAPVSAVQQAQQSDIAVAAALRRQGWKSLMQGSGREWLQKALELFLIRQRWFGGKTRKIKALTIKSCAVLPPRTNNGIDGIAAILNVPDEDASLTSAIFFAETYYEDGGSETYQLPLALAMEGESDAIVANSPSSVVGTLVTSNGSVVLQDATFREGFRQQLLGLVLSSARVPVSPGNVLEDSFETNTDLDKGTSAHTAVEVLLEGWRSRLPLSAESEHPARSRIGSVEQSNTSLIFDDKLILKLFRRLQVGENPDIEIGRFLSDVSHFPYTAPFVGDLSLEEASDKRTSLGMLQGLVANQGDGWAWTLEALSRFYDSVSRHVAPVDHGESSTFFSAGHLSADVATKVGDYLEDVGLLGKRTAEMHLALATETTDPAFCAEPLTIDDLRKDAEHMHRQVTSTLDALRVALPSLTEAVADNAALLLSKRLDLHQRIDCFVSDEVSGHRIRVHGDYHLGQILRAQNDFVVLDFEGEPARTLEERRRKQSPLKDVAGMLRSFSYAAWTAFDRHIEIHLDHAITLEPWVGLWQTAVSTVFLTAYRETADGSPALLPVAKQCDAMLNAYLLEKSMYELLYELNNRPSWVRVPLTGILALLDAHEALNQIGAGRIEASR